MRSGAAPERSLRDEKGRKRGKSCESAMADGGGAAVPSHQVRFDKRWMIRRRPYGRSVSELTPPKMKCTPGDPRTDPNAPSPYRLSLAARPSPRSRYFAERRHIYERGACPASKRSSPGLYTRFGIQIPPYVTLEKMFIGPRLRVIRHPGTSS